MQKTRGNIFTTNFSCSIELQFLISACYAGMKSTQDSFWADEFRFEELNWSHIYSLASLHQVSPLLSKALQLLEKKSRIPSSFLNELHKAHKNLSLRSMLNFLETNRLMKELNNNGIVAIPYKGEVLSKLLFDQIAWRESTDIDLFIYKKDIHRVQQFFEQRGIKREHEFSPNIERWLVKRGNEINYNYYAKGFSFHVEPHHRSNHDQHGASICLEQMESDIDFISEPPSFKTNGHLVLLILNHGVNECWMKLKYLCDLFQFLQKFGKQYDWQLFFKHSYPTEINVAFLAGCNMLKGIWNVELPTSLEQLLNTKKMEILQNAGIQNLINFEGISLSTQNKKIAFRLKYSDSYFYKIKLLFSNLFHPNMMDFKKMEKVPKSLIWMMLYRPLRILQKYFLKVR